MRIRHSIRLALGALATSACAGGGGATLGYGVPSQPSVAYVYGDTTLIGVSVMGQSMDITMRGTAEYGVVFARAGEGVRVTMTVQELDATLAVPMAGSQRVDESQVDGALVFSMDRRGNATIESTPTVTASASRMISGLTTAHTFFPGLPDRAVAPGDQWVDTISYQGDAEVGALTESSVYRYTVVGDTAVAGRALLKIALAGTTEVSSTSDMGGMQVKQRSTLELQGHVLWDRRAGVMFETVRRGKGTGSAVVPLSPTPLPITVDVSQRARLGGT